MKGAAVFGRVMGWIALVFTLFCHGLTVFSVMQNNEMAEETGKTAARFDPALMLIGMGALLVGVILFTALRRCPAVGAALTVLGGIALGINAVRLGIHFPLTTRGITDAGLTVSKLIWRHWTAELVPLFTLLAFVCEGVPRWTFAPEAIVVPEDAVPEDAPAGTVLLRCPRCEALFRNGDKAGTVFRCPYCLKKVQMPGKSWEGKRKKRSVAKRSQNPPPLS